MALFFVACTVSDFSRAYVDERWFNAPQLRTAQKLSMCTMVGDFVTSPVGGYALAMFSTLEEAEYVAEILSTETGYGFVAGDIFDSWSKP